PEQADMPAAPPPAFAAALAAGPLVLDAGMSNQLTSAGHDLLDALWSARLLPDDAQAVVAAKPSSFDRAGAAAARWLDIPPSSTTSPADRAASKSCVGAAGMSAASGAVSSGEVPADRQPRACLQTPVV
ncbi:hypothetical protein VM98_33985, partial [Streptomyces rubellomurinus subsp. indigoferus]